MFIKQWQSKKDLNLANTRRCFNGKHVINVQTKSLLTSKQRRFNVKTKSCAYWETNLILTDSSVSERTEKNRFLYN